MMDRATHIPVALTLLLALLFALVVTVPPATAVSGDATLQGTITDAETGSPFPVDSSTVLFVDMFRTSDRFRFVIAFPPNTDGTYQLPDIPPGDYRVRFRFIDSGTTIEWARYQWYTSAGPVTNYDLAETITFAPDETKTIDQALIPIVASGSIVVNVTDAVTSLPPPADSCRNVTVFEASGIGIGIIPDLSVPGPYSFTNLPNGDYKTLFAQRYAESEYCTAPSPEYLDEWYGGARGAGFQQRPFMILSNAPYFATGAIVNVSGGAVPVDFFVRPTPRCNGLAPTIIGTSLADTIDGTAGPDVILTLGGSDTVRGFGGKDRICAGSGNDTVRGGNGPDYVSGGDGRDVIRGGNGNDDLRGNRGNDTIIGGAGTDVARGGQGTDSCTAETVIRCE